MRKRKMTVTQHIVQNLQGRRARKKVKPREKVKVTVSKEGKRCRGEKQWR